MGIFGKSKVNPWHLKKGSKEAKEAMAKVRAQRGKKKTKKQVTKKRVAKKKK